MLITSPANPRIAKVRDLQTTRGRKKSDLFLIEGLNLFEAMLDAQVYPQEVYYQPELLQRTARGNTLLQRLLHTSHLLDSQRIEVNMRVIEAISDAMTSQGIVGVVSIDALFPESTRTRRATQEQSRPTPVHRPALLVLDDISDPGNMGTILRTALAADVDAVLLTPNCTDPYSPKVLRAATGTHFFLPIESDLSWEKIAERIHNHSLPDAPNVLLAEAGSTQIYYDVDLTHPFTLIIGNEAHGPSREARALATNSVTIPLANHVESLNAAIATAILLYEAVRQVQRHNNT
ncbi:MAG TPA: RNA methyltransferase [Ktedonobacter sp.]|nr:RNA methyltransferase [Ktedonobacter sp.]